MINQRLVIKLKITILKGKKPRKNSDSESEKEVIKDNGKSRRDKKAVSQAELEQYSNLCMLGTKRKRELKNGGKDKNTEKSDK